MKRARRAGALGTLALGAAWLAATPASHAYTYNSTSSMPVGWYETRPPARPTARGDTILICAPPHFATRYAARGYLERGSCAAHTEPLLKYVVAVAGDVVVLGTNTISVNGRCLRSQRTLASDGAGRALARVARGRYRLRAHAIWVWAPHPRSLDSRYFGPLDDRAVLAFAVPVSASPAAIEPPSIACAQP